MTVYDGTNPASMASAIRRFPVGVVLCVCVVPGACRAFVCEYQSHVCGVLSAWRVCGPCACESGVRRAAAESVR